MKKYGYVIEMKKTSSNYPGFYDAGFHYAGPLRDAAVYTRSWARGLCWGDETVHKVELFKNGKPKKIIK